MISRISLESVTFFNKKLDLVLTIFPIVLISIIDEIYVDNPHFLLLLRHFFEGIFKRVIK